MLPGGGGGDGSGRLARFFTFYMHLFLQWSVWWYCCYNNNFTIRRTFLAGIQAPLYHPILNAQAKVPEGGVCWLAGLKYHPTHRWARKLYMSELVVFTGCVILWSVFQMTTFITSNGGSRFFFFGMGRANHYLHAPRPLNLLSTGMLLSVYTLYSQ